MDTAPQLPVAAEWFSLTWVTGRTAVLTEGPRRLKAPGHSPTESPLS